MNKNDRRVLRTRQSLIDALISLELEHGYDAVTIKDITRSANVSYSTFFRHFKNKDDLTNHVFQTARQQILDLIESDMIPYEEALVTYTHMSRNRDVYLLCANVPRDHPALATARDQIAEAVKRDLVAMDESIVPIDAIAHHTSASILELFRWWLKNDSNYSPEQMATIHCELVINAKLSVSRFKTADELKETTDD